MIGGGDKSQQCHKYLLQYRTFGPKGVRFEYGEAKFASCPGRHSTLLRPWAHTSLIDSITNDALLIANDRRTPAIMQQQNSGLSRRKLKELHSLR